MIETGDTARCYQLRRAPSAASLAMRAAVPLAAQPPQAKPVTMVAMVQATEEQNEIAWKADRLPTSADIQFVCQIHPPGSQCVRRLSDEDGSRPRVPVVSRQHSSDVTCPTTRVWSQISRAWWRPIIRAAARTAS